jgi:pyruvate/2-oxoglutarate dehydrogenase complex dihydrolipoamide dehydrogenase (E3) component
MKNYDLIVIGGGAGGLTVAAGGASLGAKVALIEKKLHLGGDCLHYGCVPSKALITSAKKVYAARKDAEEFRLKTDGTPDISIAMNRVKAAIAEIQEHDSHERFKTLGVDIYTGKGRFVDKHHVQVENGPTLKGKRIVIATGSRPFIPPMKGIENVSYLTNEAVFNVQKTPGKLLVIGGGPIGLEIAQSFARFGSNVTVIETSSTIFDREDEELIPIIQEELEKELTFRFNTSAKSIREENGSKIVTIEQEDQIEELVVDEVLIATGRKPNTDHIGLENIDIKVEQGTILVNEYLQTAQPHIFSIGDTNGNFPFTHAAGMEGKLVIRNALFGIKGKVNYENVPWITYTDPEVFHLGLTEKEAREKHGSNIHIFKVPIAEVDRFVADRDKSGLLKVITDPKGRILGAHAVGKNAGDWMQEIVFAKANSHKIGDISNVIHPYPTHGAIIQQAADQFWRKKLFAGVFPKLTKKYIQWFR